MADSIWASKKTDWHDDALCGGADPTLFFPTVESMESLELVNGKFCNHCPVRGKCLNSAIINKDTGYWGGTGTAHRQAMKRTRSRAKCPVCTGVKLIPVDEYEVCVGCGASWKADNRPAPRPEPEVTRAPGTIVDVTLTGASEPCL
jgi:hypothetical protein